MINSAQNPKFRQLMKLKQKKYRLEQGLFLVEGEHLVKEAIAGGNCELVVAGADVSFWKKETIILSPALLKQLSDLESPQFLFALCRIKSDFHLGKRLLLIDGIQDPGNLGTLLRSALAFGFDTIVYENTVDIYCPKVIRGSQGALFGLSLINTGLIPFISDHPDYKFYGTSVASGKDVGAIKETAAKIGLILGNEGQGVRKELLHLADEIITIPMEKTESLNVSVAGSIIMYQFYKAKSSYLDDNH
ncbi:MAG: TrmH family RNA methyltransferase [Candidatus Izemoplasmatales bacterium]|jgi:TrmH family RNA methyltransferase